MLYKWLENKYRLSKAPLHSSAGKSLGENIGGDKGYAWERTSLHLYCWTGRKWGYFANLQTLQYSEILLCTVRKTKPKNAPMTLLGQKGTS